MKPFFAAVALAGALLSAGTALADNGPLTTNPTPEEREWYEFQHVQRGWFPGGASANTPARRVGPQLRRGEQVAPSASFFSHDGTRRY